MSANVRTDWEADRRKVLEVVERARRHSATLPAPEREQAERMVAEQSPRAQSIPERMSPWIRLAVWLGLMSAGR